MRCFLFVTALVLFLAGMPLAQEQATISDSSAAAITPPDSVVMAQEETGPVAVPAMSEKARRYYQSGSVLWFVNLIWGMLISALFLFTGFSAKIRNWAQRLGRKWFFVMGHEMGHYVLGHVIKGILFFSLLILITLYAAYRTADGLINKNKDRFGFDQLSDIASLPLIMLLVGIFTLVITPIALAFTRYQEHEADRFGLEITQSNHAAAIAFVKSQQENLGNPRPGLLYKLWRSSHPALGDRIDFCNEYRPWENGETLKYGELFKR